MDNNSKTKTYEYKIGELNVRVTSNTPSPEAIADANEELNKMAYDIFINKR